MSEEKLSRQDKAFTTFLLFVLKAIEVVCYVGIVIVWGVAVWIIWKSGWKSLYDVLWPLLGVFVILVGSIWSVKLLKRLVI